MNAPLKRETALACRRLRKFSATLYALALSTLCLGFAFALCCRGYSDDALNVSQLLMSPLAKPALNQRERCAEVPCVNESGVA